MAVCLVALRSKPQRWDTVEVSVLAIGAVTLMSAEGLSGAYLKYWFPPHIVFNKKLMAKVRKLTELAEIGANSMFFRTLAVLRSGENTDAQVFYDFGFVPSWQLDFRIPGLDPKRINQIMERLNDTLELLLPSRGIGITKWMSNPTHGQVKSTRW